MNMYTNEFSDLTNKELVRALKGSVAYYEWQKTRGIEDYMDRVFSGGDDRLEGRLYDVEVEEGSQEYERRRREIILGWAEDISPEKEMISSYWSEMTYLVDAVSASMDFHRPGKKDEFLEMDDYVCGLDPSTAKIDVNAFCRELAKLDSDSDHIGARSWLEIQEEEDDKLDALADIAIDRIEKEKERDKIKLTDDEDKNYDRMELIRPTKEEEEIFLALSEALMARAEHMSEHYGSNFGLTEYDKSYATWNDIAKVYYFGQTEELAEYLYRKKLLKECPYEMPGDIQNFLYKWGAER